MTPLPSCLPPPSSVLIEALLCVSEAFYFFWFEHSLAVIDFVPVGMRFQIRPQTFSLLYNTSERHGGLYEVFDSMCACV